MDGCSALAKVVFLLFVLISLVSAQSDTNAPRTIKVGIARIDNQSARAINTTWERDQLVQNLGRSRTAKKSNIVIEAVSLDSTSREDAGEEAARKDCRYFVLTSVVDFGRSGGVLMGKDRIQPMPPAVGNADITRNLTVNFTILEVGAFRALTDGAISAPVHDGDDLAAADDAMRTTAQRVASEIRKDRPPKIE